MVETRGSESESTQHIHRMHLDGSTLYARQIRWVVVGFQEDERQGGMVPLMQEKMSMGNLYHETEADYPYPLQLFEVIPHQAGVFCEAAAQEGYLQNTFVESKQSSSPFVSKQTFQQTDGASRVVEQYKINPSHKQIAKRLRSIAEQQWQRSRHMCSRCRC